MRYRKLGKTGLEVSEVDNPIIRLSHPEAVQVLRRAPERAITLFNSAGACVIAGCHKSVADR